MAIINRRSLLALGSGAASLLVLRTRDAEAAVGEETEIAKGVKMKLLGEGPSLILGYNKVSMRDIIYEPGAVSDPHPMENPMICHIMQGELTIVQDGKKFVARKNYVWTCAKDTVEGATNNGTTVAIMRITDLLKA